MSQQPPEVFMLVSSPGGRCNIWFSGRSSNSNVVTGYSKGPRCWWMCSNMFVFDLKVRTCHFVMWQSLWLESKCWCFVIVRTTEHVNEQFVRLSYDVINVSVAFRTLTSLTWLYWQYVVQHMCLTPWKLPRRMWCRRSRWKWLCMSKFCIELYFSLVHYRWLCTREWNGRVTVFNHFIREAASAWPQN